MVDMASSLVVLLREILCGNPYLTYRVMKSILAACRSSQSLLCNLGYAVQVKPNKAVCVKPMLYHHSELSDEAPPPLEWYEETYPELENLSLSLKHLDLVDGKLVDICNSTIITDAQSHLKMQHFKTLAREFLGSSSVIEKVNKNIQAALKVSSTKKSSLPTACFSNPSERVALHVRSLTTICNCLNISAQQRKVVRFTICPLVTRHQMWTSTLEEILTSLHVELESSAHQSKGILMGRQIVSSCLNFLSQTTETSCDSEHSCSWMSPKPKRGSDSSSTHKWGELYVMFKDLIECLRDEEQQLGFELSKLEAMKEGLMQIKDVLVDRNIGFKEVKHQESLVQKKLVKNLGHSSKCLFTLLHNYLYGTIRDLEVDVCGGVLKVGGEKKEEVCLYMGRIVSCDDDEGMMVRRGVRQLDRALELFKFVWETARMKEKLRLHGHVFCVGGKDRTVRYKGNLFFVHGINL